MRTTGVRASNGLLESMSRADFRQASPYLTHIDLSISEVLADRKSSCRHVYFPISGAIAIYKATITRTSVALVATEGMVGASVAAGIHGPPELIVVHAPGAAMRMEARRFQLLTDKSASLQRQVHGYTCRLLERARQMAVCNSYHSIEARLARCLLESSHQVNSNEIRITQELLSYMIGGRRSGINLAATSMRGRKLIEYARGRLHILNRRGLGRLACACYEKSE